MFEKLSVVHLRALGADSMGESGLGVLGDVALQLALMALFVADRLAKAADGQNALQLAHLLAQCTGLHRHEAGEVAAAKKPCFQAAISTGRMNSAGKRMSGPVSQSVKSISPAIASTVDSRFNGLRSNQNSAAVCEVAMGPPSERCRANVVAGAGFQPSPIAQPSR